MLATPARLNVSVAHGLHVVCPAWSWYVPAGHVSLQRHFLEEEHAPVSRGALKCIVTFVLPLSIDVMEGEVGIEAGINLTLCEDHALHPTQLRTLVLGMYSAPFIKCTFRTSRRFVITTGCTSKTKCIGCTWFARCLSSLVLVSTGWTC